MSPTELRPHDGASRPYGATAAPPPPPPEPPGAHPRAVRLEATGMIHTDAADQQPQPETVEEITLSDAAEPQHESGGKIPRPNGQDALQAAIGRLARLPELEYDLIDYTAEAERLGLDGVGALKRAVGRARKAAEAAEKARAKAAAAEAKAKAKAEEEARIRAETPPPLTPAQIATEIERLAGLDPIDYNRERIDAKKRLGFTRIELLDTQGRPDQAEATPPEPTTATSPNPRHCRGQSPDRRVQCQISRRQRGRPGTDLRPETRPRPEPPLLRTPRLRRPRQALSQPHRPDRRR